MITSFCACLLFVKNCMLRRACFLLYHIVFQGQNNESLRDKTFFPEICGINETSAWECAFDELLNN